MRTWDEIAAAVKATEKACKDWETDEQTPMVEHKMREVRAVSAKLDRQWSELYDLVTGGEIEPIAYPLVMAMDEWIDEVDRFRDSTTANPGGTDELWRAWKVVLELVKRKPVPQMLETIDYLINVQKCSPAQVARIYEWKDEFGQPDSRRVLEIFQSGEEQPPTVSPHWTRLCEKNQASWEARTSRQRQSIAEPVRQLEAVPVVAPETIDTLLEQNVPSRQIARMKNIDQQTVIDYAREVGMVVDGQQPVPAMTPDQHLSRVRNAESTRLAEAKAYSAPANTSDEPLTANTHASLNNYREQVRQMALDGCSKQQIVQGLKSQHPDRAKPGSVAQIMAAITRESAATSE